MKQETRNVVAASIDAKQLAVDHVRYPCQRMPIANCFGECPDDIFFIEPGVDVEVFYDISDVIVYESAISYVFKRQKSNEGDGNIKQPNPMFAG